MSFYASTELYVWELMQWHESGPIALLGDFDLVRRAIPANRVASLFDFGRCGVGTDGLFLAGRGYDVTLADVDEADI